MVPKEGLKPQPLVCSVFNKPSALSIEPTRADLVVGVGIEPTFRVFQTRSNPSQLSDQERRTFLKPSFVRDVPSP